MPIGARRLQAGQDVVVELPHDAGPSPTHALRRLEPEAEERSSSPSQRRIHRRGKARRRDPDGSCIHQRSC